MLTRARAYTHTYSLCQVSPGVNMFHIGILRRLLAYSHYTGKDMYNGIVEDLVHHPYDSIEATILAVHSIMEGKPGLIHEVR